MFIQEISQVYKVTPAQIQKWILAYNLPYQNLENKIFIDKSALGFLKKRLELANPDKTKQPAHQMSIFDLLS